MAKKIDFVFLEKARKKKKRFRYNNPFTFISKTLIIFGLNIDASLNFFMKTPLLFTGRIIIMLYFALTVIVTSYGLYNLKKIGKTEYGSFVSSRLSGMIGILVWISIFRKSPDVWKTMQKLRKMAKVYRVALSFKFKVICIFWLLLIQITGQYSLTYLRISEGEVDSQKLTLPTLNIENKSGQKWFTWFYLFLIVTYFYTFPCCIAALYLIVCRYTQKMLTDHVERSTHLILSSRNLKAHIRHYGMLLDTLHFCEETFSFPIFFTITISVFRMFYCLWAVLKHNKGILGFFALNSFSQFASVSGLAAMVSEADSLAKRSNNRLLQSSTRLLTPSELFLYSNLNSGPSFAFSGWGIFLFTKSFFLAALGSILTYSLLVINIEE